LADVSVHTISQGVLKVQLHSLSRNLDNFRWNSRPVPDDQPHPQGKP